jgi:hypothetical protein
MMDFLNNLASLALGEISKVKPLFNLASFYPDNNTGINETNTEVFSENETVRLSGEIPNENLLNKDEQDSRVRESNLGEEKAFIHLPQNDLSPVVKSYSMQENEEDSFQLLNKSDANENNIFIKDLQSATKEKPFASHKSEPKESISEVAEIKFKDDFEEQVLGLENKIKIGNSRNQFFTIKKDAAVEKNLLVQEIKKDDDLKNSTNMHKAENTSVKINIGRIELRAVYPEQKRLSLPQQKKPQLSLDNYLKSFNKG